MSADEQPPARQERTQGVTTERIVVGHSTQEEVMELLGVPDSLHRTGEREIWTYEESMYEVESGSGYFTVLRDGGGAAARPRMLIVCFNERDIVSDYRVDSARR
jgi:hypothetical protein